MATLLVPYNSAMQLGSGFNSFTQQLCIDHAVGSDQEATTVGEKSAKEHKGVAQSVTYKMTVVDKTTDVTDEMKITAAFNIKNDQLTVDGNGKIINTNKIKESDFSIMVSVKVVNQSIYDHSLVNFQPITGVKDLSSQRLVEIYGDSFISGWQEGGEFLAIISIKAKDRQQAQVLKADASVAFSSNKKEAEPEAATPEDNGKEKRGLSGDVTGKFDKIKKTIAGENEVSISVTWTGGGQNLKRPEQDWDFNTMRDVALKFPDLCAKTPMRTHALLTKYTALRTFHSAQAFEIPLYDRTGAYTSVLQEAYLDYKAILAAIQVLAFDVSEGTKGLITNPRAKKAIDQVKAITQKSNESPEETSASTDAESVVEVTKEGLGTSDKKVADKTVVTVPPPAVEEPFAPDIEGLEEARLKCRFMMSRIIQEIDNITIDPKIATDETRQAPYTSPFLFKMLLPIGVALPSEATAADQATRAAKLDAKTLEASFVP